MHLSLWRGEINQINVENSKNHAVPLYLPQNEDFKIRAIQQHTNTIEHHLNMKIGKKFNLIQKTTIEFFPHNFSL